jgi:tetratricopeptide (TPR) repeat protein
MPTLTDAVHDQVKTLCAEGDRLAKLGDFPAALDRYWEAWDLLPAPAEDWEAATWILAAVGDANFLSGDFVAGRDNLSVAMRCPNGLGNRFLHLRLGECRFELGELDRAADDLGRAYMEGGPEIFKDEDSKYLDFLRTRMQHV